jgi:hypothetical protein
MTNDQKVEFIVASCMLSRAAPERWAAFMRIFEVYVSSRVEEAVQAATTDALVSHGRAQSLLALRKELREVESQFKKLQK